MQYQSNNASGNAATDSYPAIGLLRCGSCAALTYPASAYGCHRCGMPRAGGEEVAIPARGVLLNWVTVYVDVVPGLKAPYIVGEVQLAPGVIEEVLIDAGSETELEMGQILVAAEYDAGRNGAGNEAALRFVPQRVAEGVAQ